MWAVSATTLQSLFRSNQFFVIENTNLRRQSSLKRKKQKHVRWKLAKSNIKFFDTIQNISFGMFHRFRLLAA